MADSTLYIDEAGDLGIGRGSDWFVLAGVLVNKTDETQIRDTIRNIRAKLNINEIHFRKMVSFDKKAYATAELAKCPFEYIVIIADTNKISLPSLHSTYSDRPSILSYNHICRYLIERASWLLRDTNRTADIVLSSRGTSRDADLISYIKDRLIPGQNEIANRFEQITAKSASSWDLLQLADVCATSMYNMYQMNGLDFITPCYAYRLNPHLYRYRGQRILKYGIKYYDDSMAPNRQYFIDNAICKK